MAEKLNGSTPGVGHNGGPTRATYLAYIDEYADADSAVESAVAARKDLRKRIKGAGFNLAAFDRTRKDSEKSGEKRIAEERAYQEMMAWRGMPVGYQTDIFEKKPGAVDDHIDQNEPPEHLLRRVKDAGFTAGKAGQKIDGNPWNPGSLLYTEWHSAWKDGQEWLVQQTVGSGSAAPKGRGRPKGSGKGKGDAAATPAAE